MHDGPPPGDGDPPARPAEEQPGDDPPPAGPSGQGEPWEGDAGASPSRSPDPEDRAAWVKLCNLQRRILPQEPPAVPGFRLRLAYRPAFVVTGDYHDFFARPDGRTAAFLGDGSGHGPAASMLMAIMRTILRVRDEVHREPGRTLADAGRHFHDLIPSDLFMTGVYLLFGDDGWVSWAAAGHHPPVWVARSGVPAPTDFTVIGPVLGLDPGADYPTVRWRLAPRDRMILFTDGLYEARNRAGEPFNRHRVWQYLQVTMDDPLEQVVGGLVGAVRRHLEGAEFEDDFTILAVERADPPAAP